MAKVEIDLSEYDMMREAKKNAEARVETLTEEVKRLKDTSANVVVKNRYYLPAFDCTQIAHRILSTLEERGIESFFARDPWDIGVRDRFGRPAISPRTVSTLANIIQQSLSEALHSRTAYREDTTISEIRGFSEMADSIREKLESDYRVVMEQKQAALESAKETYNLKHLDLQKAVDETKEMLNKAHKKELDKVEKKNEELEKTIEGLKEELKEASKTSEQKLAEALAKLHAAEAEVAKYSKPRKKFLGIF